jgi:hypothetical protein
MNEPRPKPPACPAWTLHILRRDKTERTVMKNLLLFVCLQTNIFIQVHGRRRRIISGLILTSRELRMDQAAVLGKKE